MADNIPGTEQNWGAEYVAQQQQNYQRAMQNVPGYVAPTAATAPAATDNTPVVESEPNAWQRINATIVRGVVGNDDQALKFATDLGATDADITRLNNAIDVMVDTLPLDPRVVNHVLTDIASKSTPDKLITAFASANPAAKPVTDIIAADPAFKQAVFDAVTKDPTVLEGLTTLVGNGSAMKPADMAKALQDPETKRIFSSALTKIAEDPNLEFSAAAELIDSGVAASQTADGETPEQTKAKRDRYKTALGKFGETDNRLAMGDMMTDFANDPMGTLVKFLENPGAFLKTMMTSMGYAPEGPVQEANVNRILEGVGGLINGPELANIIKYDGPILQKGLNDLTGATDRQGGRSTTAPQPALAGDAGNISSATVRPSQSFNTASGATEPEEKPAGTTYVPPQPAAQQNLNMGAHP